MPKITPEEAQQYSNRWALANAFEIEELQRTSMQTKLRQLSSLMASRELFALDPQRDRDVQDVRQRWAKA